MNQCQREACSGSIMWSAEIQVCLQLIEFLHSFPALWDVTSVDYKNRLKKVDAMREISDELSMDVGDVERKI